MTLLTIEVLTKKQRQARSQHSPSSCNADEFDEREFDVSHDLKKCRRLRIRTSSGLFSECRRIYCCRHFH